MHNVFASRKRLVQALSHIILGIAPRVPRKRVSMTLGEEDGARALDGLAMIEDHAKPASSSDGGVHYGTLCDWVNQEIFLSWEFDRVTDFFVYLPLF